MADQTRFDLHASEKRFELLVNSVTDYAIYMLDPEGHIVSWNAGARRFKGYEADEILGQHFSRFLTPADREAGFADLALKTAREEGRFEAEGWRLRKDGTRFWANAIIDPIWNDEGQLVGFAKITRDITDKKEAAEELSRSEQRFRMLVQGVHDYAIYMLDPQGRVTNWNSGAEAIKGYSAGEVVGEHFSRFYTQEDRAKGQPAYALATALSEGKFEGEAWRVRKDGTHFRANVVIDPIYADNGDLIGFAKITRDVTERYQAQQELDSTRAALFQSQKMQALGELTGGIAHDFNNLMTVICGSADLLRRGNLSEEKQERYLNAIIETADRASTLTSHLLSFGRRQSLKPEVIDLNLRMDAFAEVLARTLGGQIDVSLDLAPGLWATEVDSAQLETALLNAAINARDAMPDGGRITVSTRNLSDDGGDMVCVSIADDGAGMTKEVLARAFEPFFTTKDVGKGTGLGLSQIHGFAAQTGGRAEIDSSPGHGTTVSLFLPRSEKPVSAASHQSGAIEDGSGRTVLLVEDNRHVREFAEALLTDLHYEVISAETGERALELLRSRAIDVIFSDVVMPGISGVELARTVRQTYPDLPIVLASGYSEEIIQGAASEFQVLAKPYGAGALGAALSKARSTGGDIPPQS